VDTGLGDDDGSVDVRQLTPSVGIAETFSKWKGCGEPLDCFAHVGIVQHGYYGRIWCRAVLLQHGFGMLLVVFWSSNETKMSCRERERA
jgi:hypothetical protein